MPRRADTMPTTRSTRTVRPMQPVRPVRPVQPILLLRLLRWMRLSGWKRTTRRMRRTRAVPPAPPTPLARPAARSRTLARAAGVLAALGGLAAVHANASSASPPASVAPAAPIAFVDDRGQRIVLRIPAQRIVSLLPSLTEAVCALQACDRLVGVDRSSNWPGSVAALPRLGGLEDTAIERIVALRPDLVLAPSSSRAIERLESLGLVVAALEPKDAAHTRRVLDALAQALGRPLAGDALWRGIEARIDSAAARVPAALRGRSVYFEVSDSPHAAGEASFIGETLARLGLRNVVPAALGPFPQLNPEFVVRAGPDIVMAAERALERMPRRPGWGDMTALRSRRVCGFAGVDYDLLVRPGPRMGEAAERIADCLAGLGSDGASVPVDGPQAHGRARP
jgi:iron complex transport system substrate-binding protein